MSEAQADPASTARLAALADALPGGIVDAHHHFWALHSGSYPWLQDGYDGDRFFLGPYRQLCCDYGATDLRRDSEPLLVAGSVHIEAERDRTQQVAETRWLGRIHEEMGLPSVIVGHVSFLQPDLDDVLDAHAQSRLFRGVRSKPVTAERPGESVAGQPGTLQDERWLRGLAGLVARGLSWDLRVPFWHLEEAARVVAGIPGIPVALNHCGLPLDRSPEGLSVWRGGMEALAAHSNVSVKLSEFGLRAGGWDGGSTVAIVREAAAIFGVGRVMFGSNLPVSGLSAGMPRIAAAVLAGLGDASPEDLRRVFASNARRFYRIAIAGENEPASEEE